MGPGWLDMWTHLGPGRGWAVPARAKFVDVCAPDGPSLIGTP
jgi:hypothetical protein